MEKYKREVWIDFAKVLAIFLVIILHTVSYGVKAKNLNIGLLFYYLGTLAIPMFFMVNGYLQLRRKVDYKYVIKKIFRIMFIVFIWNLFFIIYEFIKTGKVGNIVYNILINFLQGGYFYQFWFLGALIIIYLFLPVLSKIFNNKNKVYFITLTILLTIICIYVDLFNIRNNNINNIIIKNMVLQTFRIWTWFMYFCWGGFINKTNCFGELPKREHLFITILTIIVFSIYQYCLGFRFYSSLFAENFYDSAMCIFTTILVFTYLKKVDYKNKNLITLLGQLTMGIYIIHLTIIKNINNLLPLTNNFKNIIIAFIVFGISASISYIIYKIPKLNNIIKL